MKPPRLNRREFLASTAAAGLLASPAESASLTSTGKPLEIAEWSFLWVGIERADLGAKGTFVSGKQMYVEYQIPAKVRHPYPIVLVHGGGGQGLDWMGTPDGRRGWSTLLLEEGYMVYVVDRPGHGKSPFHPDLHGNFPQRNVTLEQISGQFTPQRAKNARGAQVDIAKLHNQWPGSGEVGSKELFQLVASQGGSYGNGPATGSDPAHMVWRQRGAELLDKIGPAIVMTHSAGGPFGWLVAEARPNLVKGIIAVEGGGQPFSNQNRWGMSTVPVEFDPPVQDPSEIKLKKVDPTPEDARLGVQPYNLQEEPARKLKNLQGIPIAIVTAEASFASPGNPGGVAMLKQAGCMAEELRLAAFGVKGNGHMMMMEKNNREVLQPILKWIDKNVKTKGVSAKPWPKRAQPTSLKLADLGYFWVGTEGKQVEYGTVVSGQMFVQYAIPQTVKSKYPIVLVHGGGGQGGHYWGLAGEPGWAHYYLQAGYPIYVVDRPGHGRSPYHPDALGPIGAMPNYATVTGDFKRAAVEPNRRWMGTGDVGDPLIDQFQAGQNATPADNRYAHRLWASRGAELLDKIGPAIVQVHSAGGPFSWIVANERPKLVKALVNFEGAAPLFTPATPWGITTIPLEFDPPVRDASEIRTKDVAGYKLQADPPRKLKNLQGIPIVYITAERSGRNGVPVVEFLKQAGCDAELMKMEDKGVRGNGHFMMLETNKKQAFDVIRAWIESKVKA